MLGESPDPTEEGPFAEVAFRAFTPRGRKRPVAVAVAAVAFVGFALLIKELTSAAATPVANAVPPPSPLAAAMATPEPSVAPATMPTSGPPAQNPTATPYPTYVAVPAHTGKSQLLAAAPTPVRLTVTLPTGWEKAGPAFYLKPGSTSPVGLSIGAYSIQNVNTFPCRWSSDSFTDTAYPRTAAGLALALSAFWGQDPSASFFSNATIAPVSSRPRPTTIGGHPALYVEVLIPSILDFSQCDGGQLVLWESLGGPVRYGLGPGEIDRLWVVDVRGALVVIDAALPLLASRSDAAELQRVIDSVVMQP
jgi:hypothetical protein